MSWHKERNLLHSLHALRDLIVGRAYVIGEGDLKNKLAEHLSRILPSSCFPIPGYNFQNVPINPDFHYIIVGSPSTPIAQSLANKLQSRSKIIHAGRLIAITPEQASSALETQDIWLECIHSTDTSLISELFNYTLANSNPRCLFWLEKLLSLSHDSAESLGDLIIRFAQHPSFLQSPNILPALLKHAKKLRLSLPTSHENKPILLYPSGGRCGGNSIHYALQAAKPTPLSGGHETRHVELYELLRLQLRCPQASVLTDLALYHLLSHHDALGGNPFCFLLDQILALTGFNFCLLAVSRNKSEHLQSILERNFHYADGDPVPKRVTATNYQEIPPEEWAKLSRKQKVEWYLDKVERCVQRHASHPKFIPTKLRDIEKGLTTALRSLDLDLRIEIQHLNTVPTYRNFSPQELSFLYQNFQSQELHNLEPAAIEEALASLK